MIATTLPAPVLAPVEITLADMRVRQGVEATRGLVPGLILPDGVPGWVPASDLVSRRCLGALLEAAKQRWGGSPHACAALTWKCYTYWLALPAVVGWAAARRVPLLEPEDVLVRASGQRPFLRFALRRARVAVLPSDPLAVTGSDEVLVVASEQALLGVFRDTLRTRHLDPLLAGIRSMVRIGERMPLGSAGIRGRVRRPARSIWPSEDLRHAARTLLSALDVGDLVELVPTESGFEVQRRTCCLAFTLPQPKVCSGCCIRSA